MIDSYLLKINNMKSNRVTVDHTFPPLYDSNTEILILGSFPSVKSREQNFYYMHPQNRFYKVLDSIFSTNLYNASIDEKKNILLKLHIGLYDVIDKCTIVGSSDSSIENVVLSNIEAIVRETKTRLIILNGNKAYKLFSDNFNSLIHIAKKAPSTSPANAQCSLNKLIEEWKKILEV